MKPDRLPVYKQKEKILEPLAANQVVVVESPTGSGKTTQIPQILYEAGYSESGLIGMTQPRRIAAVSVSEFIARQLGVSIPDIIGYKMRFEDRTGISTRIKIMTDGILLQEIKADYSLSRYSVIMVDEAHERSLNIDFILGLLKRILTERDDFKVIISSATINAEVFSEYFDECPIVKINTRIYPVKIIYDPPVPPDNYEAVLDKIHQIVVREAGGKNNRKKRGDILVFLPGERAIKDCIQILSASGLTRWYNILPLYGRLSSAEQERVFDTYPGKSKVIVATNIAETSVTIDGITAVIDPGQAKMNFYNQKTFTSSLNEVPISRASCNQRKGRAGRTAPGNCYRLFDQKDYHSRRLFTQEEIQRTDLSEVVLRMAELGIQDFSRFDFLSPPDRSGIDGAVETLRLIDAIDDDNLLTSIGRMMVKFPMLPKHSRMIVEAINSYPQVLKEVLIAASFLTTNSPFLLPIGQEMEARRAHHVFRDPLGDFLSYLRIFHAYRNEKDRRKFCERSYLDPEVMAEILNVESQLSEIISDMGIPILSGGRHQDYLCAVSRGLIQFVCARSGRGVYRTLTAGRIYIHPGSVMYQENPSFIVAGEIVKTTRMYARSVSPLKPDWLRVISPLLHRSLVKKDKGTPLRETREFTNNIKIGSETFSITKIQGKKTVILPWNQLKRALDRTDIRHLPNYKNLRGKILFEGSEILTGRKLNAIMAASGKIHPERGILRKYPEHSFSSSGSLKELFGLLDKLLCLCRRKSSSKQLGFLSLRNDGSGNYRFRCVKGFFAALTESLSSLECLADEESGGRQQDVSQAFRHLSELL